MAADKLDLVGVYSAILASIGLLTLDDTLSYRDPKSGNTMPATVGGKHLVLPTREILRASRWDEWVAFHPLCEDAIAGESPVFKALKAMMEVRISSITGHLMEELMGIAIDSSRHGELSTECIELLRKLEDVNENTLDGLKKVLRAVDGTGTNKIVHIRVQRGGSIMGKGYRRATLVTYPILTDLKRDDLEIFGVKVAAKKTKRAISDLFTWLLDVDMPEPINRHSVGSDAKQAPGFHSLVLSYASVMSRLCEVSDMFKKQLPAIYDDVRPDMTWVEDVIDLSPYYGKIPILTGNDREAPGEGAPVTKSTAPSGTATRLPTSSTDEVVTSLAPRPGPGGIQVRPWSEREYGGNSTADKPIINRPLSKEEEEEAFLKSKRDYETQQQMRYTRGYGGNGRDRDYDDRGRGRDRGRDYDDRRDYRDDRDRGRRDDRDDGRRSRGGGRL